MIELPLWVMVLAGFLPYLVRKKRGTNGTIFTIRALAWSLAISRSSCECNWVLRVPLFERMRHLVWDVLCKRRKDEQ